MSSEIIEFPSSGEMMAWAVPPHGVGAEIGVHDGRHAAEMFAETLPLLLHLVDPWKANECDVAWGDQWHEVEARLRHLIQIGRVVMWRERGADWLRRQQRHSLDWLYLDASHTYDDTREEIAEACRVIRPGGVLAGHDLVVAYQAYWRSGVVRAVIEACQDGRLEMLALTNEAFPSWACRVR